MIETIAFILLGISITALIISIIVLRRVFKIYKALKPLIYVEEKSPKKIRKRYVVFTVSSETRFKTMELKEGIEKIFIEYYGKSLYHKTSPQLIFFDEEGQRGVYRTTHLYVDYLIATMGLVKSINGRKCLIIPIRTTGTLKKARKYMEKLKI